MPKGKLHVVFLSCGRLLAERDAWCTAALPIQLVAERVKIHMTQVPKAFKIIPNLLNWEEVLQLTDPENWSPHAM
jgi:hypothetical protein